VGFLHTFLKIGEVMWPQYGLNRQTQVAWVIAQTNDLEGEKSIELNGFLLEKLSCFENKAHKKD